MSTSVFSSAAKVAVSHKVTSSVSAVAIVVAGSMIVSAQTSGTKQQVQQTSDLSVSSQTIPESSNKSDLTTTVVASVPDLTGSEQPQQKTVGQAQVDITTGDDVNTNINVNGQHIPTPDTSSSTYQTVPTTNDTGNLTLSVSAHNESGDNSKNKSTNTMRISTSSSSKSTLNSSETTKITGDQ
jgi:hypothetical protein